MKMAPEEILKIIRVGVSQSQRSELKAEHPLKRETIDIPFKRMVIRGGFCHDFIKGFYFEPWKLVIEEGTISKYKDISKDSIFTGINYIKKVRVLKELPKEIEKIPNSIKRRWTLVCKRYNAISRKLN